MASTFQINTYWNVDTLATVFNGVAAIFNSGNYTSLIKLIFILGLGIAILVYAMGRQSDFFKWFLQSYIMVSLLMIPVNTVTIVDVTNQQPPKVVSNVPWTMAALASVSTEVQYWLTKTFEATFGIPDSMNVVAGDVGFGHRILRSVNQITIQDPNLKSDLMQFFKECTTYDVRDGAISPKDLIGKVDTWNLIFTNTSPARFVTYDTLTSNPKTDTCTNTATVLKNRIDNGIAASTTYYGKSMFTRAKTDAAATSLFIQAVGDSSSWILNNAASTSSIIKQSMFNNMWREAGSEIPAMTGDNARLEQVNAVMGATQAAAQISGSQNTITLLAQEAIPHMRNWIEAIIYACFPLVVLLILLSPAEAALKILGGYAISILWLGLIPVMWAVINDLSLLHLKQKMVGLSLVNGGVPFQLSTVYDTTLFDEQSAIGWMIVLTPALAGMFLKLASGGFTSLAGSMMASMNSMGASAGASTALGNNSIGQTSLDNASVNNTSMNKYDSSMGVHGGGMVVGQSSGNIMTVAGNGSTAISELRHERARRYELSKHQEAGSSQQSQSGVGATFTTDKHANRGYNASFEQGVGTNRTRGNSQRNEEHTATNWAGSHTESHERGKGIDKNRTGEKTAASELNANATFSMGAGVSTPGDSASNANNQNGKKTSRASRVNNMAGGGSGKEAGGKETGVSTPGRGKVPLFAHAGLNTNNTSSATNGMRESSSLSVVDSDRTNSGFTVTGSGEHGYLGSKAGESSQNTSASKNAALTRTTETGGGKNAALQKSASVGDSTSRSRTDAFTIDHDMLADAAYIDEIAAANGMSSARFNSLPFDRQLELIQDHMTKEDTLKSSTAMPTESLNGNPMPTAQSVVQTDSKNRGAVGGNPEGDYKTYSGQTGAGSTAPVDAYTEVPSNIKIAVGDINEAKDPNNANSLTARSAAFVSHVNTAADLNTPVGKEAISSNQRLADVQNTSIGDIFSGTVDNIMGKPKPAAQDLAPTPPGVPDHVEKKK